MDTKRISATTQDIVLTALMRITAGRMVIMGGLIATATRIIEITVTTTTQDIVNTVITGTKTIAIMATGRAGTMCTKAASIRDAALDMATYVTGGASVKPAARARAGA